MIEGPEAKADNDETFAPLGELQNGTADAPDSDRIDTTSALTVPNAVSALRVIALPFLALAVKHNRNDLVLAVLFAIGLSDWADGVLARHLHQISNLGKIFDPVCDRIAIGGALILLTVSGYYPVSLAIALLVRESIVSVVTIILALLRWPRVEVSFLGKAATLMIMFSLPLFVVAASEADAAPTARALALIFGIPGTLAYYTAMLHYGLEIWRLRARASRRQTSRVPTDGGVSDAVEALPRDAFCGRH